MRQVRWLELLGQYKFTIYYIFKKDNGRADALNKRLNYMIIKKESFALLAEEENGTLTNATAQLNTIISMDDGKTIKWKNGKKIIDEQNIDDCIRRHHNPLEFGHPGVNSTTAILRRSCYFKNMQARVRAYMKKCRSCQWNKHSMYTKYGPRKIIPSPDGSWQEIIIDFITKLPKSKNPATGIQYDLI